MSNSPARPQPNVLVILTDQHSASVAGFAGDSAARTPNLDKLAAKSVRFTNAISPSPLCTPARMCLLTGKEANRCAAWQNHWAIFPEHITWPAHFAANGYRTCLVGKMHFGGRDQMQGFQDRPYGDLRHGLGHQPDPIDQFPGYSGARSAGITEIPESLLQENVVTREALAYILEHESREPDAPWFVCASYSRPHPPFTAPGRYIRASEGKVPMPPDGNDLPSEPYAKRLSDRYADLTRDETRLAREAYYACVEFVDHCIGELLDGLGNAGALDNTIVVYTSDHGEMGGSHGIWAKTVYYESSVAVPMLIKPPGGVGGAAVDHPASLIDLYPTTCALAGIPIPEGLDGVDLSPSVRDPLSAAAPREIRFSLFCLYGQAIAYPAPVPEDKPDFAWRLARTRDLKLVEIEGGQTLLFNLKDDPHERTNLANDARHAAERRRLHDALESQLGWSEIHRHLALDRERLKQFKSGERPTTPNQYRLPDGRIFDAEGDLYEARWLRLPDDTSGGIIPQQFG